MDSPDAPPETDGDPAARPPDAGAGENRSGETESRPDDATAPATDGGTEAGPDDATEATAAERDAGATPNWLDFFEEMVAELERREEVTELTFEELTVDVPLEMDEEAPRVRWGFDGTVRVHVEDGRRPLLQWLRWWQRQAERER